MLTLDHSEVGNMTGRQLLERLGHNWLGDRHNTTFRTSDDEWHVYQTQGRGRQSGRFYVHIWRRIPCVVREPGGEETILSTPGYIHLRGTTYQQIVDFQNIA